VLRDAGRHEKGGKDAAKGTASPRKERRHARTKRQERANGVRKRRTSAWEEAKGAAGDKPIRTGQVKYLNRKRTGKAFLTNQQPKKGPRDSKKRGRKNEIGGLTICRGMASS